MRLASRDGAAKISRVRPNAPFGPEAGAGTLHIRPAPGDGGETHPMSMYGSSGVVCAAALALTAGALGQAETPALFVVNNVSAEITSFAVTPETGGLTLVEVLPTAPFPQATALSPNGRWLAVTHATKSDTVEVVRVYEVQADASLELVVDDLTPDSPLGAAWIDDEYLAITQTDFGGANLAIVYRLNERAGTLTPVDQADTGTFNTSLAADPATRRLYAQDSFGFTVYQYNVDLDGMLSLNHSVSTSPVYPLDLSLTPAGDRLFAGGGISNSGNKVNAWLVGEEGVESVPGAPFVSAGASPAYTAVTGDGQILVVGHGTDATVRTFGIQPDGSLAATSFVFDVGLQGTIGDIQTLGDLVFVTDESTALDGITGVYAFRAEGDGTLTQLGAINLTGGVRPEAMAVWAGDDGGPPADLDGDGVVGPSDLALLLASWGVCEGCPADLNNDGVVDAADLADLLAAWG